VGRRGVPAGRYLGQLERRRRSKRLARLTEAAGTLWSTRGDCRFVRTSTGISTVAVGPSEAIALNGPMARLAYSRYQAGAPPLESKS
jgi:hypothetical protein